MLLRGWIWSRVDREAAGRMPKASRLTAPGREILITPRRTRGTVVTVPPSDSPFDP